MRLLRTLRDFVIDLLLVFLVLATVNYAVNRAPAVKEGLSYIEQQLGLYMPVQTVAISPGDPEAASAVSKVAPAVVSIFGYSDTVSTVDGMEMVKVSAGTGFFVKQDGYILTNRHVVADAEANYSVVLSNGRRRSATVVYRDPDNDLAMVKISGSGYPVVKLGDSSKLKLGQNVFGIGNAYGRSSNTVSAGTIAAMHRSLSAVEGEDSTEPLRDLIQTTAQLYPGDSGGPLFDLNGNVIGIDVAIAAQRNNVSFAIPINDAAALTQDLTPGTAIDIKD